MKVLVVDVGGSQVKVLATDQKEIRRFASGKTLTPERMVENALAVSQDWTYEAVSIGYPGRTGAQGPLEEPGNLAEGWVGFDYARAFGRPVKILNDAVLQALGSYQGGRMLFLGLGTGLGSTLIASTAVVPLELGELPFREGTLAEYLGQAGLERLGQQQWQQALAWTVPSLQRAFAVDYVMVGGGNASKAQPLPQGARLGGNEDALQGGLRLWETVVAPIEHVSPAAMWKLVL